MDITPIWLIGLLGGLAFAWAGVPAAIATARSGRSIGTPLSIILYILFGVIMMYVYFTFTYGMDWIITLTYLAQLVSWGMLLWYHFRPRKIITYD